MACRYDLILDTDFLRYTHLAVPCAGKDFRRYYVLVRNDPKLWQDLVAVHASLRLTTCWRTGLLSKPRFVTLVEEDTDFFTLCAIPEAGVLWEPMLMTEERVPLALTADDARYAEEAVWRHQEMTLWVQDAGIHWSWQMQPEHGNIPWGLTSVPLPYAWVSRYGTDPAFTRPVPAPTDM